MYAFHRTILIGMGYQEGDWNISREKAKQINIIEPVVEGVMQLFFQTIILYIVYGPGTPEKRSITGRGGCPKDRVKGSG